MPDPAQIGLAIFILYFLVVLVLGLIASRSQHSTEDFWLAGRRFGLPLMVMANMAAIMNGGALISGAGYAARFGGVAILPFFGFAAGIAIIFFALARCLGMRSLLISRLYRAYTCNRFDFALALSVGVYMPVIIFDFAPR